jgi:hypothetical protein
MAPFVADPKGRRRASVFCGACAWAGFFVLAVSDRAVALWGGFSRIRGKSRFPALSQSPCRQGRVPISPWHSCRAETNAWPFPDRDNAVRGTWLLDDAVACAQARRIHTKDIETWVEPEVTAREAQVLTGFALNGRFSVMLEDRNVPHFRKTDRHEMPRK